MMLRLLLRLLLLPLGLGRIGGSARLGPVEHNELLAFDRRIALHDLHVAGKGRHLFLVPHFKGSRVDLNRLVLIVVQNALRGIRKLRRSNATRARSLRRRNWGRRQRQYDDVEPEPPLHRSLVCPFT